MNPYPQGQCTWGAAQMCPCLGNVSQYGNFGNGGDWFSHAQSIGLPTSQAPQVGWLASFSVDGWPDGPGDVGLIVSVNPDNTVTRYGTNWHLDGSWSYDKVSTNSIIGTFKAPCACTGGNVTYSQTGQAQGAGNCATFSWQLNVGPLNTQWCFDGVIGMLAVAGGLLIIAVGLVVMILAASQRRSTAPKQPQQGQTGPAPAQPSQPVQQTTPMTPEIRDQIIIRARQRAAARTQQRETVTRQSAMAKMQRGQRLTVAEAKAIGAVRRKEGT